MKQTYKPLISDEEYLVTTDTSEASAYIISQIPLIDCTWDEATNEASFIFERDHLLNETEIHYFDGRLRGSLLDHDNQRQVLIKRIRRIQR
jgi:hypothetical protein